LATAKWSLRDYYNFGIQSLANTKDVGRPRKNTVDNETISQKAWSDSYGFSPATARRLKLFLKAIKYLEECHNVSIEDMFDRNLPKDKIILAAKRKDPSILFDDSELVYVIQNGYGDVKIGYSSSRSSMNTRMKTLTNASSTPLVVLFYFNAGLSVEQEIHKIFANHHIHLEWFRKEVIPELEVWMKEKGYTKKPWTKRNTPPFA